MKFPFTYYKCCLWESLDFRYRLWGLNKVHDLNQSVPLAKHLMGRAALYGTGYYASSVLEKPFLQLAETIETPKDITYTPNSFLHVMTTAYTTGGHTRVAERWIASAPKTEKHSVILLSQNAEPIPERLRDVVADNQGELTIFDDASIAAKATQLRTIALSYEYVILHIHMDEGIPIAAFGKDDFTRPVILFNHADHSYWSGSSIVDMMADLRDNSMYKVRGIKNHYTLRIPLELSDSTMTVNRTKAESRKLLGLPLDKKIILTTGAATKYAPFGEYEFCDLINVSIRSREDTMCIGVGPTAETGHWMNYPDKFIPLGPVKYGERYFEYINACDVYVGSMPIDGGLAMLDALQFHKPIVSYSIFDTQLGNLVCGIDTMVDKDIFATTLNRLLDSEEACKAYAQKQYDEAMDHHSMPVWRANMEQMLLQTPKTHHVNRGCIKGKMPINDLSIYVSVWNHTYAEKHFTWHDLVHQFKCRFM